MAFDWQTEMASKVKPPTPSIVVAATNNNPPAKSFAHALVVATMTDTSEQLPTPVIRGEKLCIRISEGTYAWGVDV